MKETDYQELRRKAETSSWMKQAIERLSAMGQKLKRELNQRRRVAELNEQLNDAKARANEAEIKLTYARAEISDLQQQAQEQQEWMEQQVTRDGRTIWDFFMDFITPERERDYIDHYERE
jgi:nucleoid-associated protein YejK